jgi:hypothetical protein
MVTGYRPYALRDAQFRIMDANGYVGEVLKCVANLLQFKYDFTGSRAGPDSVITGK